MEPKVHAITFEFLNERLICNPKSGIIYAKRCIKVSGKHLNPSDVIEGYGGRDNRIYIEDSGVALSKAIIVWIMYNEKSLSEGYKITKKDSRKNKKYNSIDILKLTVDKKSYESKPIEIVEDKQLSLPFEEVIVDLPDFIIPQQTEIKIVAGEYKDYRGKVLNFNPEYNIYSVAVKKINDEKCQLLFLDREVINVAPKFSKGDRVKVVFQDQYLEGEITGKDSTKCWMVCLDDWINDVNMVRKTDDELTLI